jgi:hypothetical protein
MVAPAALQGRPMSDLWCAVQSAAASYMFFVLSYVEGLGSNRRIHASRQAWQLPLLLAGDRWSML